MSRNDILYQCNFLDELIQLHFIYKYNLQPNFDIEKLVNELGIRTFCVEELPRYYEYGYYISDNHCDLYYKDYTSLIKKKDFSMDIKLSNLNYSEKR